MLKKIHKYIKRLKFPNLYNFRTSSGYWNERYLAGGNSGSGSYGRLAEFKAKVINNFIVKNNINSLIEFGCGDGNQLNYFKVIEYIGVDISDFIINKNKEKFKYDSSKRFINFKSVNGIQTDLAISLDVVFHLIEDQVFEAYMTQLFCSSDKFVIIYSSNDEKLNESSDPHVKHREFTNWVESNMINFKLIDIVSNEYPFDGNSDTSFCDFYIFEK